MKVYPKPLTLLALNSAFCVAAAAAQAIPGFPPFEAKVPFEPTPVSSGGVSYLCYELHLTNYYPEPITTTRIEVFAGQESGPLLVTYEGSSLSANMRRPGTSDDPGDRPSIGGGMLAFVYFWISLNQDQRSVNQLLHRITYEKRVEGRIETGVVESTARVRPESDAITLGPPLKGGYWVARNGPSNTSGHRRMVRPLLGPATVTQRYAIDYIRVDENGRSVLGDPTVNANHLAYGQEIIAVADGTVVYVTTGIPNNVPGQRMENVSSVRMLGNSILLDLGNGYYAFYAHIQPGAVRVKNGDRVRRGQVIGLVGNSGQSGNPHLHFHVQAGPIPLGYEGLPYVIDRLEWFGECMEGQACVPGKGEQRRNEIPLRNAILRFP